VGEGAVERRAGVLERAQVERIKAATAIDVSARVVLPERGFSFNPRNHLERIARPDRDNLLTKLCGQQGSFSFIIIGSSKGAL